MKYIFFGTPPISVIVLKRLIETGYVPAAVVTNPDRPVGRKKIITPPPVKQLILNSTFKNIEILQPEHLDNIYVTRLRKIGAEVGVLAAYGKIIPKEIIDVFPKGIIVVHPSLLPKYRGATPVQSALLAGEQETGTCLIRMDEKVDHGPILACAKIHIDNNDNYENLSKKLFELGGDLLVKNLPHHLSGKLTGKAQNESQATYVKKFTSEDAFVDPVDLTEASLGTSLEKAELIWRKVRALNPEPGVWTIWQGGKPFDAAQGRRMKILETDLKNGKLILKKIQFEGEKPRSL